MMSIGWVFVLALIAGTAFAVSKQLGFSWQDLVETVLFSVGALIVVAALILIHTWADKNRRKP